MENMEISLDKKLELIRCLLDVVVEQVKEIGEHSAGCEVLSESVAKLVTKVTENRHLKIKEDLYRNNEDLLSPFKDKIEITDLEPIEIEGPLPAPPPPPPPPHIERKSEPELEIWISAPKPPPPILFVKDVTNRMRRGSLPPVFRKNKSKETLAVRIGKIPRSRIDKTIFKKKDLLQRGNRRYFTSDSVKNLLQEKFQVVEKKEKKKSAKKKRQSVSSDLVPLVDDNKSLNCSIVCSKILDKNKVLDFLRVSKEWVYNSEAGQEVLSRIDQIRNMFNETEMKLIYGKGRTLPEDYIRKRLSIGDQFILRLFQIPLLEAKLDIYDFLITYKPTLILIRSDLIKYLDFCHTLKNNSKFLNFLSLILGITNFLNQDVVHEAPPSPNEKDVLRLKVLRKKKKKKKKNEPVIGMNMRSLLNLVRVKNPSNPRENLLDVVYSIILKKDKNMLEFRKPFSIVNDIVKTKISEKQEMLDKFGDRFTNVIKNKHFVSLKNWMETDLIDPQDELLEKLTKLIPDLEEDVADIEDTIRMVNSEMKEISDLFGHPVDSLESEFFTVLKDFLQLLDKTESKYERMEKKRERRMLRKKRKEERKAKKDLMNLMKTRESRSCESPDQFYDSIPETPVGSPLITIDMVMVNEEESEGEVLDETEENKNLLRAHDVKARQEKWNSLSSSLREEILNINAEEEELVLEDETKN